MTRIMALSILVSEYTIHVTTARMRIGRRHDMEGERSDDKTTCNSLRCSVCIEKARSGR